MICSFIMDFQSLHPHVTDASVVAFTILTPSQQLITRYMGDPLNKTRINVNVSLTFITNCFKFCHFYILQKTKIYYLKINFENQQT